MFGLFLEWFMTLDLIGNDGKHGDDKENAGKAESNDKSDYRRRRFERFSIAVSTLTIYEISSYGVLIITFL